MAEYQPLSASAWKGRFAACRVEKREYFKTWQDNVSYRRGKPFRSTPPEDTVNVPVDWARTKNKVGQLFYQVPELILKARRPEFVVATSLFAAVLNFKLTREVHVEHTMNECLPDAINAAGIAICKIGLDATFEEVEMGPPQGTSALPPSPLMAAGALPGAPPEAGMAPPAAPQTVPRPLYECYYAKRISPAHFLWPAEFLQSNWQEAPWLAWEGYEPLASAQRKGWVEEGEEGITIDDKEWLLIREGNQSKPSDRYIKFVECFYRPHVYDPAEPDPRKIKRLVMVEKHDEAKAIVVDEPLEWQRYVPETRKWVGLTTFPIKVLHLTKITDLAIPPSDSEIGRPQVRELIKARSQMMQQRDHSIPLRWFDVNMVDTAVADKMRKGKWQGMVPTQGPGDKMIGEIARASYPHENWEFDKVARFDLDESWSMSANQQGISEEGQTTATEVTTMRSYADIRLDSERQWVLRFFLEIAEGIGALLQLFADDEEFVEITGKDGTTSLQPWNKATIAGEYVFEAKPDSQLRLDITQKRTEALNLYKLLRQDPLINPVGLVSDVLEVHGYDPSRSMAPQQPPKPEKPKVGYSFKGEDLANPLVIALVQKTDTPVTPEDIAAAKKLLQDLAPEPTVGTMAPELGMGGTPPPPTGDSPEHPGVAPVVQPMNQRYGQKVAAPGDEVK